MLSMLFVLSAAAQTTEHWVGTWGCAPQLTEPNNLPPAPLADSTLRQFVRVSIGGKKLRIRFSNAFGSEPVALEAAHIALASASASGADGAIVPGSDTALKFSGSASATVPAGRELTSDPLSFDLPRLTNVAVTIRFGSASAKTITGHPGSRTTSFVKPGDAVSAINLPDAKKTAHWYILTGIDVLAEPLAGAVITLGDSITDGRGTTTDGNNRWPDVLAERLAANPPTANVAVLNMGIGGNGIFGGLGPSAQARFDRDVLGQAGARWLIFFEGVNDIGAGHRDAQSLTNACSALVDKAHAQHLLVFGATITPFGGSGYSSPAHETARQAVNDWIRHGGKFDAVLDFDAIARNPQTLTNLLSTFDTGDHLHLNPTGYRALANSIPLSLFK